MSQETANAFNDFKEKFKKLQDDFNRNEKETPFGESNINEVKKQLEKMLHELSSIGPNNPNHLNHLNHQIKMFIEAAHQVMIHILSVSEPQFQSNDIQKMRYAILDFLGKKVIQTSLSNKLLECMMDVMEKDNEKNASLAPKILNDTIKACSPSKQENRTSQMIENGTLLKMFQFMVQRTQFINELVKELQSNGFTQVPGDKGKQNITIQQRIALSEFKPNNKSIAFIGQIPHIFVHLMAYPDMGSNDNAVLRQNIYNLIKLSIQNIMTALKDTPYPEILARMPRWFSQDLFQAFQKLAQFLFIIVKRDKELEYSQYLVLHVKEQMKHINLDQIVAVAIKFLKNCPDEMYSIRQDMMFRIRQFLQAKRDQPQSTSNTNPIQITSNSQEIMSNAHELIDEEHMVGRYQRLSLSNKVTLQNHWLSILNQLLTTYLHRPDLKPTDKLASDFIGNQINIEKILNVLIRYIFDDQTQILIHEKSIESIRSIMDMLLKNDKYYFVDMPAINAYIENINGQQQQNMQNILMLEGLYKENQNSVKIRMLNQLLQVVSDKFEQVYKQLIQARKYLQRYDKWIKKNPSNVSLNSGNPNEVNLNSLPANVRDTVEQQKQKFLHYAANSKINIQQSLLSINDQQQNQLVCFEDDEELIINLQNINSYQNYEEFVKDCKSKVLDNLVDVAQKVIQAIQQANQGLLNRYREAFPQDRPQQQQTPLLKDLTSQKLQLCPSQSQIFSKILKYSLLILEELHTKNHYELIDKKRNNNLLLLQLFVQINDGTNFKDIFEPNTALFIRLLVKLQQECSESTQRCLEVIILEQFNPSPNQTYVNQRTPTQRQSNPFFLEYLMSALLKELQNTPESPSIIGFCRTNKRPDFTITQQDQEYYVSTLLKLVRQTIREFTKTREDRVFRPIIKQLTLFLIKKLHESYFPLDYMAILISLIKRIQQSESPESLWRVFQIVCEKSYDRSRLQGPLQSFHNSNYMGVNIALNLFYLFQSNVLELQDNVAEFIVHLPISKNQTIALARQYPIYSECIYRALHYMNYETASVVIRSINQLDIIASSLSQEELKLFFGDGLERMLHKLVLIAKEIKWHDQSNKQSPSLQDPFFKAMKLLGRLGTLSRNNAWQVEVMNEESSFDDSKIQMILEGNIIDLNFSECVKCAADLLNQTLQKQIVATYFFKPQSQDYSYKLLKMVVNDYLYSTGELLKDDFPTIKKCIRVYVGLLNLNSTGTQTHTVIKIKEDIELQITLALKTIKNTLINKIKQYTLQQKQYPSSELIQLVDVNSEIMLTDTHPHLVFLRILLKSLMKKVVVTYDETQQQRDSINSVFEFVWTKGIYNFIKQLPLPSNQFEQFQSRYQITIMIEFLKKLFVSNICKECLIDRSDAVNSHLRMLQAFGQSTNPSEGINIRTASLEALVQLHQIQGLRPSASIESLEAAILSLSQLPEHIKLRTALVAHELAFAVVNQFVNQIEEEEIYVTNENITESQILKMINLISMHFCPKSIDVCVLFLDLLDLILDKVYKGDASKMYFVDLITYKQNVDLPITSVNGQNFVNLGIQNIIDKYPNTLLGRMLKSVKSTLQGQKNKQLQANAFLLLEFTLGLKGNFPDFPQSQILAMIEPQKGEFSEYLGPNGDFKFKDDIQYYIDLAFSLWDRNEKQYAERAKLIFTPVIEGQQPQQQQCQINPYHYLDDLEYNLNIEQIDLEVKEYAYLIKNIYVFCKSILIQTHVQNLSKIYQKKIDKNAQERQSLLNTRFRIVEMLYEGLTRVESSIRKTAYKAIRELLAQENGYAKELFQNDDKLKRVMKPVLTCLQQEPFHFVPSFLYSLKMILKLFTQVFHRTLSERMQVHLIRIVRDTTGNGAILPHNQPYTLTGMEWYSPQFPESLTFQTSCIQGILKLFQHLTSSFHHVGPQQAGGQNGQVQQNPAQDVIKETIKIEENFKRRVGHQRINLVVHKPLVKFLNTVSALAFEDFSNLLRLGPEMVQRGYDKQPGTVLNIYPFLNERNQHLRMMTLLIKEKIAYPLRERFCRETNNFTNKLIQIDSILQKVQDYAQKTLLLLYSQSPNSGPDIPQSQYAQYNQLNTICKVINQIITTLSQFTLTLTKRNSTWLRGNQSFFDFLSNRIRFIQERISLNTLSNQTKQVQKNHFLLGVLNQLMIPVHKLQQLLNTQAKILVSFHKENPDHQDSIVMLMVLHRNEYVRTYIKTLVQNSSITLRQQFIRVWLQRIFSQKRELDKRDLSNNDTYIKRDIPCETFLQLGQNVIYPIVLHAKLRGDMDQVIDLDLLSELNVKITELTEEFRQLRTWQDSAVPLMKIVKGDITLSQHSYFIQVITTDLLQLIIFIKEATEHFEQNSHRTSEIMKNLITFGWEMIRSQDKIVEYFAKLYLGKFFKNYRLNTAQSDQQLYDKMFKIYHKVLKYQDDNISSQDQEILVLCRKIIQAIIPQLDQRTTETQHWINFTLQILTKESGNSSTQNDPDNMQKLCRFWSMFIRNHETFNQHFAYFNNQIINSMQQIGCYSQPNTSFSSSNSVIGTNNYKRIALDIAFLSVEWRFKNLQNQLILNPQATIDQVFQVDQSTFTAEEKLSQEIYLSFFIKQALNNLQPEEKEIQRRALYLLKKVLMMQVSAVQSFSMTHLKKHMDSIIQQIQQDIQQQPQHVTYIVNPLITKFYATVITILNIILEYQPVNFTKELLQKYLFEILGTQQQPQVMMQMQNSNINMQNQQYRQHSMMHQQPQQQPPQRYQTPQQTNPPKPMGYPQQIPSSNMPPIQQQTNISIMAVDSPQIVFYVFCALKKMLAVAFQTSSSAFISNLLSMAFQSMDKNIHYNHQLQQQYQQQQQQQRRGGPALARVQSIPPVQPMSIKQSVFVIKEILNYDHTMITNQMLTLIKSTISLEIDQIKRREKSEYYLQSLKQHPRQKVMEDETDCELKSYLEDFKLTIDDFPFGMDKQLIYFPDDFPIDKLKFHLQRTTILKGLKVLTYKFTELGEKEQQEFIEILIIILDQVGDWELKLEVITILRVLFLNQPDKNAFLHEVECEISKQRADNLLQQIKMIQQTGVQPSQWSLEVTLKYFFDPMRLRIFDKKIDIRSSDSTDNSGQKILDIKYLKHYFMFLCELIMSRGRSLQSFKILVNRDIRNILITISKMSSCTQYLRFFYRQVLNVIGNSHQSIINLMFENPLMKKNSTDFPSSLQPSDQDIQQKVQTDGEEILLLLVKFLLIGKGELMNQNQQKQISLYFKFLTVEYLPLMFIYQFSRIPLQDNMNYLKDVIVPASALNILDRAQNISSRLLKPLFIKLLDIISPTGSESPFPPRSYFYKILIEFLKTHSVVNGVSEPIVEYLLGYLKEKPHINVNLLSAVQVAQYRNTLDQLFVMLLSGAKSMLSQAQYVLEELNWHTHETTSEAMLEFAWNNEVQLMQIFQTQQERRNRLAIWQEQAATPWVQQLVFLCQLRDTRRALKTIWPQCESYKLKSTNEYWNSVEQQWKIEASQDSTIVKTILAESLAQLSQWGQVKSVLQIDRDNFAPSRQEQTIPIENLRLLIQMGIREWKRDVNKRNVDRYLKNSRSIPADLEQYYGALVKLMEHDELCVRQSNQPAAIQPQQILSEALVKVTVAQVLCFAQVSKLARSNTLSHSQWISNQLFTGEGFREAFSKIQIYDELDEALKPVTQWSNQQEHPSQIAYEHYLERVHQYRRKKPDLSDGLEHSLELQHQRLQIQISLFLRFEAQCMQIPRDTLKPFMATILDTDLPYHSQLRKLDLLDLVDDNAYEVPDLFQEQYKMSILVERAKHAVQFRNDYQLGLQKINSAIEYYNQVKTNQNTHAEDCINNQLARLYRLKLICCMHLLENPDYTIEESQKELVEKALKYPQNQYKVFRSLQQFYFHAHRNYKNNIQFGHNVIKLAPHTQYLKNSLPELSSVFYILLVSNPKDSYIIDAFKSIADSLTDSTIFLFLPQFIQMHQNDNIKDTVYKLLSRTAQTWTQFYYHQDQNIKDIINTPDIEFFSLLSELVKQDPIEDLLGSCGNLLQEIANDQTNDFNNKFQKIMEKVKSSFKVLEPYNLSQQNDPYKILSNVYLASLKYIYKELIKVDIGDPKSEILTKKLEFQIFKNQQQMIPRQQLFDLHKKITNVTLPDLIKSNIYAILPYLGVRLVENKYIQRTITLVSQDEKRHTYILGKSRQKIYNSALNLQLLDFINIMLKKHKETLVRQMEVRYEPNYYIYKGNQKFVLTLHRETSQSVSGLQDQLLCSLESHPTPMFSQVGNKIPENMIQNHLIKCASTIDIYQAFRKVFLNTLATQMAVSYVLSSTPRTENMMIDSSNGMFFHASQIFQQVKPNPLSIRFTRNFEKLCGEIGVNGYLVPGFAAFALALSQPILNFSSYLKLFNFQFDGEKSNELVQKVSLMVFDQEVDTMQNFTNLPIKNQMQFLLLMSQEIYSVLDNIKELKPWI